MTHASLPAIGGLALTMALAGFAFGIAYFAALRRTVTLFAAGRGWLGPLLLTLARIAAAAILLAIVAKLGATALLAALLGFLVARAVALRFARSVD